MTYYVVLDTETTGLDPKDADLLEVSMFLVSPDLKEIVDEFTFKIKHDIYRVTARAMLVNGINLQTHHAEGLELSFAANKCYLKCLDWIENYNANKKLTLIGHNIQFDYKWLGALWPKSKIDLVFEYRCIDTHSIAWSEQFKGNIPDMKLSLVELAKHFGIEHKAHTAKGDVIATLEVLRRMLREQQRV